MALSTVTPRKKAEEWPGGAEGVSTKQVPREQNYTDKWWLNMAYPEDRITYLHLINRFLVRIR